MRHKFLFSALLITTAIACTLISPPPPSIPPATQGSTNTAIAPLTDTAIVLPPSPTLIVSEVPTAMASLLPTSTTIPTVESLQAIVTADLLSCRYGPGAEYLYLYALRKTANIKLIGRTDANQWVWVDGKNKCWVNSEFLDIQGDPMRLPIVYPGIAKLPVSPYYPGPRWAKATRKGENVEVYWEAVPISPGKYEDENMHQYIVEVWRCEGGQIHFETLGTNFPYITVENDQTGCNIPSHGKVFVQEKHGYGGPAEIPWPAHP